MADKGRLDPQALKGWRTGKGWTQSRAAAWFRVHIRTYQGWEAGRRKMQAGPISKIVDQIKSKEQT